MRYGPEDEKTKKRSRPEFEAIAVDIFGQATPAEDKAKRPLWKSIIDVQQDHDDLFKEGADTDVFLLTKAQA